MKAIHILLIAASITAAACNTKPQTCSPVFVKDKHGLLRNYIKYGNDSAALLAPGQIAQLSMAYFWNDSLLFRSSFVPGNFRMALRKPETSTSFEAMLLTLRPGDSLHFYLDAAEFYGKTKKMQMPEGIGAGDSILFHVSIIGIETEAAVAAEKEAASIRLASLEQEIIADYAYRHFSGIGPSPNGLYIKTLRPGSGPKPKNGEIVSIDYAITAADGTMIHTTSGSDMPFSFKLGSGTVIQGIEDAVAGMQKGSHALVLVPSALAYGAEGYRFIRPHTPLVAEIKLY
jgi:FKBP-type peptidyl-prolyl cis-trans isomerase FkpA